MASPQQTDASVIFARWAHWRHLANTIELVLPWLHGSVVERRSSAGVL